MKTSKTGFKTVDEYIATFPAEVQTKLQEIRVTIKAVVPDAREKISYQIAAVELNGKNLMAFAGWKNHVSIYPIPSGTEAFNNKISPYIDGKGTLKFPLDQPLPLKLITKIVKLHVVENLKNAGMKSTYQNKGEIK